MIHKFISASEFIKNLANTVYLYKNLWRESSVLLLHGPQDVDKTLQALEIAAEVSSADREIVYVNAANSLDRHADRLSSISNLMIFTPEYESPDDSRDYADLVISSIEEIISTTRIRTFIIDSVSRIAALSFGRNSSAAYVMKRLAVLQKRYRLSLLVIANDSTRSANRAILNLTDSDIMIAAPAEEKPDRTDSPIISDKSDKSYSPDKSSLSTIHRHKTQKAISPSPKQTTPTNKP